MSSSTTAYGHRTLHLQGCGQESCRIRGRRWSRQSRSVTWLPVCPSLVCAIVWPIPRPRSIDGSTLSFLLQRVLEVKRKEEEEAVEAAELVELEEKLAAAEGAAACSAPAGPGGDPRHSSDLVHALPRRSACRSLVPGQRGGWEEEGKEEEEEEAEDVEDSPVSAPLLFVMSLTILVSSWFLRPLVSGSQRV